MPTSASDPVETELKFALGPGAQETLLAGLLDGAKTSELSATYFDTADLALFTQGYVLRVRRKGDRFIQTLKGGGDGLLARGEWEAAVPSPVLDGTVLAATPAADIAAPKDLQGLFTVEVRRTAKIVTHGSTRIEASLDLGEVRADGRRKAIAELELELMDGDPADLFALARTLDAPLILAFETKSDRGYRLARGVTAPLAGALAPLRHLSEAIQRDDQASATAAALGMGLSVPQGRFDKAAWADLLLAAAQRTAGLSGADT